MFGKFWTRFLFNAPWRKRPGFIKHANVSILLLSTYSIALVQHSSAQVNTALWLSSYFPSKTIQSGSLVKAKSNVQLWTKRLGTCHYSHIIIESFACLLKIVYLLVQYKRFGPWNIIIQNPQGGLSPSDFPIWERVSDALRRVNQKG